MKVLLASYFALPNSGGLWTYVQQLRLGLQARGYEVDLLTHSPDLKRYVLDRSGRVFVKSKVRKLVEERVIRSFRALSLPMNPDLLEIELERYLMEIALASFQLDRYDVIHTQDIISTRAVSRVKPAKTPLVATIHGSLTNETIGIEIPERNDQLLRSYLHEHEFLGVMSSDLAIMPSQWLKDIYNDTFGVSHSKMTVIPNGIDVEKFRERTKEELFVMKSPAKKVIICNARLSKVKGHVYLFNALEKLKAIDDKWICWLVGDGEIRDELIQLCHQLGLEKHVLFLGNRNDVPTLVKAAHLCVLPSLLENCPYAVMEAQVAGTPIIATDVGGVPDMIVHKKTGLLIPAQNSDALYFAIKKLLNRNRIRMELRNNGREWGRKYWSLERMIMQTIHVYKNVTEQV